MTVAMEPMSVCSAVKPRSMTRLAMAAAHLLPEERRVHDAHLDEGIRAEGVVEPAHRREHGLLLLVAHAVVARVVKGDGGGEQALLHLADAVLEHLVVADVLHDGLRAFAPAAEALGLGGQFLVAVLELALNRGVLPLRLAVGPLRLLGEALHLLLRRLPLLAGQLAALGLWGTPEGGEGVKVEVACIRRRLRALAAEPLARGMDERLDVEAIVGRGFLFRGSRVGGHFHVCTVVFGDGRSAARAEKRICAELRAALRADTRPHVRR